jgi:hypothetical protein
MKNQIIVISSFLILSFCNLIGQTYSIDPTWTPNNILDFRIDMPVSHLDINKYTSSKKGIFQGQAISFRFHLRENGWPDNSLFFDERVDNDLDASNGVGWSDWFNGGTNLTYYKELVRNYNTCGRYTITSDLRLTSLGNGQNYDRVKSTEIVVVPMPTTIYKDNNGVPNRLFYWSGYDNTLNKPLLVVEPFDPNSSLSPEEAYSLGYDVLENARTQGYDVFLLKFGDGGASIVTNQAVFLNACNFIHNLLGSTKASIQVIGLSMGGVIARYGLANAEDQTYKGVITNHYVNTFISFDSPQQGANVNSTLQSYINSYATNDLKSILQSPAATEMLYNNVYKPGNTFYQNIITFNNNYFGYTNGYPRNCKVFALSNSNGLNSNPGYSVGSNLATINIFAGINILDIISFPVAQKTLNIPAESRDIWPGSTYTPDLTQLNLGGNKQLFNGWGILALGINWRFAANFNPAFVPYESSSDIHDFTRNPDGSISGGTSWFVNGTQNQSATHMHSDITSTSVSTIINWLNDNINYPYLGTPTNIQVVNLSYHYLNLSFKNESINESGTIVERSLGNGQFQQIVTLPPNSSSFNDYNLLPNNVYHYRLKSNDGSRLSIPSNSTITTQLMSNIGAPGNLTAQTTQQSISVSWNPVNGATKYRIYKGSSTNYTLLTEVSGITYTDNQVQPGNLYKYIIVAVDINGYEGAISTCTSSTLLHASLTSTAFSNNSQRKFVRTADGTLHMVYESMGHVWYEMSTDNGTTWTIANNNKPLDVNGGKLPAMDYGGNNIVVIVWEEANGGALQLKIGKFQQGVMSLYYPLIAFDDINQSYSQNLNPVIAYDYESRAVIAWENKGSFVYPVGIVAEHGVVGTLYANTYTWAADPVAVIPSSDINSINPTISASKNPVDQYNMVYNLAWQYNQSSSSSLINYCTLTANSGGVTISGISNISSLDGCVKNYRPSIVGTTDGDSRVSWIGDVTGTGSIIQTVFRDPPYNHFWNFGYNVVSTSMNISNDAYCVAWSQNTSGNNYVNQYSDSHTLSRIITLNTTGKDIQLSNGQNETNMLVSSFSPFTSPYSFTTSNNLTATAKVSANSITSGRGGVISKNGAQFFYSFGDLTIDNNIIDFAKAVDTINYNILNNINNVLVTKPFTLTKNSTVIFSECSGVLDSLTSISVLGDSGYVKFKIELVDNSTNNVIGTIKDSRLSPGELHSYNVSSYNLSSDGLSGKTVKIKLTISTNLDSISSALIDRYADASSINKIFIKSLTLQNAEITKDFALDQNYPNPFNPTTVISYQLPKDGLVTVKVYDIIGKEVTTLVNGYKTTGKYSVSFDASKLASGIYFYQIRSNGFISTKKMMLLK